jgi:hypothetical protein
VLDSWCVYQGDWNDIPWWCNAYSKLGAVVARHNSQERRLIVALVVPTRAYAAAFIATGLIIRRASVAVEKVGPDDHFAMLRNLPPGAAVTYRDVKDDKIRDGIFVGYQETAYSPVIGVRKNNDHCIDWLPLHMSMRVQPSTKEITKLPKNQKGRPILGEDTLLGISLNGMDIFDYCTASRLECVLVGNKKVLCYELEQTSFAVRKEEKPFSQGRLQDILRVRELLSDGGGYKTSLISDRVKQISVTKSDDKPFVTLFDGAAGFLRWRDYWRGSSWLVVLDRTESGFEEAVAALNREYRNNCIDIDGALPDFSFLPSQVDVLAYEELRE